MTDEPQLPESELAALADGSLPAARRDALRARIDASPELAAALADQERAVSMVRALDRPAPDSLRASVGALVREPAARRPSRWRRTLFLPAATALAIVVAALVVSVGGRTAAPSIPQTARLSLAAATLPAPAQDPAHPGLLRLRVGRLAFPYYESDNGWKATGARVDAIGGRRVVTVFYTIHGGDRVGYSIVAGPPLKVVAGQYVYGHGVSYALQTVVGARLITWRRDGHTCVIAGRGVTAQTLLALAAAEEVGPAS